MPVQIRKYPIKDQLHKEVGARRWKQYNDYIFAKEATERMSLRASTINKDTLPIINLRK